MSYLVPPVSVLCGSNKDGTKKLGINFVYDFSTDTVNQQLVFLGSNQAGSQLTINTAALGMGHAHGHSARGENVGEGERYAAVRSRSRK